MNSKATTTGSLAKTDVKDETRPRGVSFYSVQLHKAENGVVHVRQPHFIAIEYFHERPPDLVLLWYGGR